VDAVKDDAEPVPAEGGETGESDGVAVEDGHVAAAPPASARPDDPTPAEGSPADDSPVGPDGDLEDGDVRDPLRFNNWMKRSATGAVMTGIAVGLQQALQLPRQEPAFVIEASGEPHDPNHPIDLHFDPDNPADTVAIIRRPAPADPSPSPVEPVEPVEGPSPPA
jgi:hypothetical protein